MKQYTTVQGDTWDKIAYSQLGNALKCDSVMNANIKYIDYFFFPAGIVLDIPEIEETEESDTLLPWQEANYE